MLVSLVVKLLEVPNYLFKRFEETSDFHDRRRSDRPNDRNIPMLERLTKNYSSRKTTNKLNNSLKKSSV